MYQQPQSEQSKNPNAPLLYQQPHHVEQQPSYEPLVTTSIHVPTHQNNPVQYDANVENPISTRIVKFGSILLFIGTFIIALFLMSDVIGGSQYYGIYGKGNSPHNSPAATAAKTFLMIINVVLMITSGVLGIVSTSDKNSTKSKYSLLHVVCLSIGMIVFLCEIIIVNISFFTTGYSITNAYGAVFFMLLSCYPITQPNSYGEIFLPFLIVFTLLSCCGFIGCCACCVSGCVRYSDISANTKEVSV